ncbi:MAG TPA: hypothetical protein VET88_10075 [Gammaproteobacteria bacterium]|nr:hypothetical protein [Gammaproteobacteria bacterium]
MLSCIPLLASGADSLDLEGTTVIGNRELPKALHIVPWKAADSGDLTGRPVNSLINQALEPLDRDVFLRELEYYEAVHGIGQVH